MIEAANAEEEALAIAVALREAVEEPGKTAALVTPDRALGPPRAGGAGALERRRSTIPAAMRSPTRRPACSRGLRPRPRSAAWRR